MKIITASALSLLAAGGAQAQGIFNVSPNETTDKSLPLKYTVSTALGWDDNVVPTAKDGESSIYGTLGLAANFASSTPQTIFDINAYVGATHNFQDIDVPGASGENYQSRLALNVSHNITPRLRVSSRNFVNYGLEPDYTYGFANDRSTKEHLYISTDNAVGFQWSERVGTFTGLSFTTLENSSEASANDRDILTAYNQFRYIGSEQTIYTFDYRFAWADNATAKDANTQTLLVGLEHRLTETSLLTARAGASMRDVDGGDKSTSPTIELAYSNQISEQLKLRAVSRYGYEEYGTSTGAGSYEENESMRLTLAGDYYLSEKMIFTGGVNYVHSEYSGGVLPDDELDLLNFHVGVTMKLEENLDVNVTYNWTESSAEIVGTDYTRNRIQVGLSYTF